MYSVLYLAAIANVILGFSQFLGSRAPPSRIPDAPFPPSFHPCSCRVGPLIR